MPNQRALETVYTRATVKTKYFITAAAVAGIAGAGLFMRAQARTAENGANGGNGANGNATSVTVKKGDFVRSLRLSGTVEAVQATTIATPRLAGQNNNTLTIMTLIRRARRSSPATCWWNSIGRSRFATRSTARPSSTTSNSRSASGSRRKMRRARRTTAR